MSCFGPVQKISFPVLRLPFVFLETFERQECGLAAVVAESLWLSGLCKNSCGDSPEAEPKTMEARSESQRLSARAVA